MELSSIYLYFSVFFIINAFVQLVIFFISRKLFSVWTALSLTAVGYVFFYRYLFYSETLASYPFLAGTSLNVQFTAVVAVYMIVGIVTPDFTPGLRSLVMLIPAIAGETRLLVLQSSESFREEIISLSYQKNLPEYVPDTTVNILYGLYMVIVFGFVIVYYVSALQWKKIWIDFRKGGMTSRIASLVFFANLIHIFGLSTTIPVFNKIFPGNFMHVLNYLFPAEVFLYFLFLQIISPLMAYAKMKEGNSAGDISGFVRSSGGSRLDAVSISGLEVKIKNLLEVDEVYLDENLTLDSFSQKVGYHSRVVSEYLNQVLHVSFKDLICDYRIRKAIQIMDGDVEINATHAGLGAGFNSTSSFYRLFKKHTGVSPDQYRKKNIPMS